MKNGASRARRGVTAAGSADTFRAMTSTKLLAGVELGGTKCVCVLGSGPGNIVAQERLPTRDPAGTLASIESVLSEWSSRYGAPGALGIASFGPLDLNRSASTYGYIASTTKPGWSNTRVAGRLGDHVGVPVGLDTDVNGAALAEGRWGAARGLANFAYITVGTGIGAGIVVNGKTVYGCTHTEMGHLRIVRRRGDDWPGACSFHGDCVEGLASGPAIQARTGVQADTLPPDHPVWDTVVHALAQLLHALVLTTAPQRIIIGGGVMGSREPLFGRIREELRRSLNGYLTVDEIESGLAGYVVPPALGEMSGPLGALVLAENAMRALDESPAVTRRI
jgi:fructokinase